MQINIHKFNQTVAREVIIIIILNFYIIIKINDIFSKYSNDYKCQIYLIL